MDYTGIIQLIIATIFYSTLVAPNIKKMSDLRADISDVDFPLKKTTTYADEVARLGTTVNKKMKQYVALYRETRRFLWLLYAAMAAALVSQAAPAVYIWVTEKQLQVETALSAVITLIIFVLLVVAMRVFILRPEQIRTFEWLSSVGIAQTYARDIFKPSLEVNLLGRNMRESNNHTAITIASDMALYGYSLILTIEDIPGEKLYHVVAGRVQKTKYLLDNNSYYDDGRSNAVLNLVRSLRLKPGEYKVRLLVFETVYSGRQAPTEITGGLTVTKTDAQRNKIDIDLSKKSPNYTFQSQNNRPCQIEFANDFEQGSAIRTLLSSPRFLKRFSKTSVLFSLHDSNGMLTLETMRQTLHPLRFLIGRTALFVKRKRMKKSWRPTHVKLR